VGTLVGKTLLTSTSNPYAAGGGGARLQNTPAALDVFGIQVAALRLRLGSQMSPTMPLCSHGSQRAHGVWAALLSARPATMLLSTHAPAACLAVTHTASRATGRKPWPRWGPRSGCSRRQPAARAGRPEAAGLRARAAGLHQHAAGALRVHRVRKLAAEPAAQAHRAGQRPEGRILWVWRRRPQGADGRGILEFYQGVTRDAARGLTQRGGGSPRLRGPSLLELHTLRRT